MNYSKCIQSLKNSRKESVVLSAAQLFLSEGIENVKMTDIAEHCEIGVASLYRYFGTKTAIVIETGSLLWKDVEVLFEEVLKGKDFEEKNGLEQIGMLLSLFKVMYSSYKNFLRFTYDFDKYILSSDVDKSTLKDYEKNVMDFYPYFTKSYEKGYADGTLRKDLDFKRFYLSVTHALLSMSQKFICGEVLESDDFVDADKELDMIIEMALEYVKG